MIARDHPLSALILRHARRQPAAFALSDRHEALTYEDLARRVVAEAQLFADHRVEVESRLAIRVSNRVGDVVRLISLAASGARVMLLDERSPDGEVGAQLRSVRGMTPFQDGTHAEITRHGETRVARAGPARGASFYLVTSGTNGRPKVVERDWSAAIANAASFATAAAYVPSDVIICTTPVHHCYALGVALLAGLVAGAEVVLPPVPLTPNALQAVLDVRQATVIQAVPFLYRWWCGGLDVPGSVRLAITAGEPASAALRSSWQAATGRDLNDHYGATEVGALTLNDDGVDGSVGRPIGGVDFRVEPIDSAHGDGADGDNGELHVRTAGRSARYAGQPTLTREAFRRGWFATGDLGRADADGHVRLIGRRGARVNVAGRKVDPLEVEHAISSFPGIVECAVVGVRSEGSGEAIKAFVVGDSRQQAQLRTFLTRRLSSYKVPSTIEYVEELPRSSSGKVLRHSLTA